MAESAAKMQQVHWRVTKQNYDNCVKEALRLGLPTVPSLVNFILAQYFNKKGE